MCIVLLDQSPSSRVTRPEEADVEGTTAREEDGVDGRTGKPHSLGLSRVLHGDTVWGGIAAHTKSPRVQLCTVKRLLQRRQKTLPPPLTKAKNDQSTPREQLCSRRVQETRRQLALGVRPAAAG